MDSWTSVSSSEKLSAAKRYKKRYKRELPGRPKRRKCPWFQYLEPRAAGNSGEAGLLLILDLTHPSRAQPHRDWVSFTGRARYRLPAAMSFVFSASFGFLPLVFEGHVAYSFEMHLSDTKPEMEMEKSLRTERFP